MCSRLNATSVTLREWRDMDNMAACALLLLLALVTCTSAQTVICSPTSMTLEADLSLFTGYSSGSFVLNDPSCTGVVAGQTVTAFTNLDLCGTEVEEVGENLVFTNKLKLMETGVINRADDSDIEFTCSYPKSREVSIFFNPLRSSNNLDEANTGSFTIVFELFESDSFLTPVDTSENPFAVNLRQRFYMRITATAAANTELFAESCKATPGTDSNDATFHNIIEDGCQRDDTLDVIDSSSLEYKFSLEAFEFIGDHTQVYIHCTVVLCATNDPNSRCTQGCTEMRRKRSVAGESARHNVIQGPLRIKRSPDEKGLRAASTPNLGFTLNVIAETLLFAVAVVCAVVAYKMKKSNTGYERFPPSEI